MLNNRLNLSLLKDILSIHTIQGRIVLLIFFFFTVLGSLTIIITHEFNNATEISEKVNQLRMPVVLATSEIQFGLAESGRLQNSYLLTGDPYWKDSRISTWESRVKPAFLSLLNMRNNFTDEENKHRLDSLEILLSKYEIQQQEIDNFFTDNILEAKSSIDSLPQEEQYMMLVRIHHNQKQIISRLSNEIQPLAEQINAILEPMSQSQVYDLTEDASSVLSNLQKANGRFVAITALTIIFTLFFAASVVINLQKSIKEPIEQLNKLAEGEILDNTLGVTNEFKYVLEATEKLKKHLRAASEFAISIGEGIFDKNFEPAGPNDMLGNTLLQMRQQLIKIALEDKQRSWVAEGMAKFSELLRTSNMTLEQLADTFLHQLVTYLNASQGGLFILNNEDKDNLYLEMIACYAYERKKFFQKHIHVGKDYGEGVIGQAFLEKETVLLTDIPQNYTYITSGLGWATPTSILIVPLKMNNEVTGIIEIASLRVFEHHEITFVERVAESIASAINNARAAEKTKKLIEIAQKQSEEITSKENQIQQLTQQLTLLQEELQKKNKENEVLLQELKQKEQKIADADKQIRFTIISMKKARENLQAQQAISESIIRNSPNPIIVVDKEMELTLINKEAIKLTNGRVEIEPGMPVQNLFLRDEREIFINGFQNAFDEKINTVKLIRRQNDTEKQFELKFYPLITATHEKLGAYMIGKEL
ncbi:MAG: GAF domain-containing protein [Cytophagales bacterium]|nr:GAF domain-containing protein [Cytophagales bacterium]MDW8384868.1 GAF domain-containing protein [Flammeovirgaceae bacterium]